jgi:hypothetical protein
VERRKTLSGAMTMNGCQKVKDADLMTHGTHQENPRYPYKIPVPGGTGRNDREKE